MQVTVLGSGHAQPTARRASSGYLVEWSGGAVLLDASAGTYARALRAGLAPTDLVALVLSHFHPDHTADLAGLLWARCQTEPALAPLPIAGPPGTDALVAAFARAYPDGWLDGGHRVAGFPFAARGLRVESFPARHSPEAVCLRLTADGKTLAYSGDTSDCDGLRRACSGADLALLECTVREPKAGHMTPQDCAAVIAACAPRRALLTHLGPRVEPGPVAELAEDGLVVVV